MKFGILDRYIGKNVFFTILLVTFCLTLLTTLITFVDQMLYIGRGSVDFLFLVSHVALEVPGIVVLFFPVAVLLGGVIALGNLARTSELIVMQSIGISRTGIVLSALKTVIPLILVIVCLGEFVVPRVEQYAENRLNFASSNGNLSVTNDGLWLREGHSFIGIRYTMSDGSLLDIVRYEVEGKNLKAFSRAKSGVYSDGKWVMRDVRKTVFAENKVIRTSLAEEKWSLNLTPERVEVVGVKGYNLTARGLIDYINYLEENNQDASSYRLELYNKFMSPLTMIVMLLLAASTVFGPLRSMTMGARVLAGIALGFGFYLANQIGAPFALVYGIPPILGASLPTLVFMLLAIALLRRKV